MGVESSMRWARACRTCGSASRSGASEPHAGECDVAAELDRLQVTHERSPREGGIDQTEVPYTALLLTVDRWHPAWPEPRPGAWTGTPRSGYVFERRSHRGAPAGCAGPLRGVEREPRGSAGPRTAGTPGIWGSRRGRQPGAEYPSRHSRNDMSAIYSCHEYTIAGRHG